MKKIIFLSTAFLILIFFLGSCRSSAVVVRERPAPPYYVRPVPPRPGYIWVDGNWITSGPGYVYRQGYWVAPRPQHQRYVSGHWQHKKQGWVWKKGHW